MQKNKTKHGSVHYFLHPSQEISTWHLVPARHQGDPNMQGIACYSQESVLSVAMPGNSCLMALSPLPLLTSTAGWQVAIIYATTHSRVTAVSAG